LAADEARPVHPLHPLTPLTPRVQASWRKDPTPTFKAVYAALVQFHLTEWLFPADDPSLEGGAGVKFAPHKAISEAEEDDDDEESELEYTEKDDDDAEPEEE